jgi:hypothetical protein
MVKGRMGTWLREYPDAVARVMQTPGGFAVVVLWPSMKRTELMETAGSLEQAQGLADTLAGALRDPAAWTHV